MIQRAIISACSVYTHTHTNTMFVHIRVYVYAGSSACLWTLLLSSSATSTRSTSWMPAHLLCGYRYSIHAIYKNYIITYTSMKGKLLIYNTKRVFECVRLWDACLTLIYGCLNQPPLPPPLILTALITIPALWTKAVTVAVEVAPIITRAALMTMLNTISRV